MASNNPFNLSEWLRHEVSKFGGHGTGSDVELGRQNIPDSHEGTQVWGATPNNVALAGIYSGWQADPSQPGVGVYGAGLRDRGIGVAGTCDALGVGVYGMALEVGIGVVGRQMAGGQAETIAPGSLVGRTAGVLGQSQEGVGVYGHGGPLMPWLDPEDIPNLSPLPNPYVIGGVFSAGWRISADVPPATKPQPVSLSNRPQIQLLPSNNQKLPTHAQLGDMYFVMAKHGSEAEKATVGFQGQLWMCTAFHGDIAVWQPVLFGNPMAGGLEVPPYVYPP